MSLMSPALVGKFFSTNIPWLDLEVSYFSYKILLHCYSNQNSVALAEGQIYRTTNRESRNKPSSTELIIFDMPANAGDVRDMGLIPGSGRFPGGGRAWQPTPVFLPGKSHGQRSLAGYSPQGRTESDTTEVT